MAFRVEKNSDRTMSEKRKRLIKILLILPVLAVLAFLFYIPFFTVLLDALKNVSEIIGILLDPIEIKVFKFTFIQAGISTLLSIFLGVPCAYLLANYEFPGRSFLRAILTVPFILPPLSIAAGTLALFGKEGIINVCAEKVFGGLWRSIDLSFGLTGIVIAHSIYNAPLVMQVVYSVWRRINPEIEMAAETLGACSTYKFLRITFPLIFPAIVTSGLLTFLFCFTSFSIIMLLGGAQYRTVEVEIYSNYVLLRNYGKAASLAFIQAIIVMLAFIAYVKGFEAYKFSRGESMSIKRGKSIRGLRGFFTLLIISLITIVLISPIVAIVVKSLVDPYSGEISIKGYEVLFSRAYNPYVGAPPLISIVNSLYFSVLVGLLSLVLSVPTAYLLSRRETGRIIELLVILPMGVSTITIALGIARSLFKIDFLFYNRWLIIVFAHLVIALPIAIKTVKSGYSRFDWSLIEASESLGASKLHTLFRVEIPLLMPSIVSSFILSMSVSLGEFGATYFLYEPRYSTLTVTMYRLLSMRRFQSGYAACSLLVFLSTLLFLILSVIEKEFEVIE